MVGAVLGMEGGGSVTLWDPVPALPGCRVRPEEGLARLGLAPGAVGLRLFVG